MDNTKKPSAAGGRHEGAGNNSATARVDQHCNSGISAPPGVRLPCKAFVLALANGWLEITCPFDGPSARVLLEAQRIDMDAPPHCRLLLSLQGQEVRS